MLYANEKLPVVKETSDTLSRAALHEARSALAAEFNALPMAEQQPYHDEVKELDRQLAAIQDAEAESAESVYTRTIGQKVWGLSSLSHPVRPDVIEREARRACPDARSQPGYTTALQNVRDSFFQSCFVADQGDPRTHDACILASRAGYSNIRFTHS